MKISKIEYSCTVSIYMFSIIVLPVYRPATKKPASLPIGSSKRHLVLQKYAKNNRNAKACASGLSRFGIYSLGHMSPLRLNRVVFFFKSLRLCSDIQSCGNFNVFYTDVKRIFSTFFSIIHLTERTQGNT